MEFARGTMRNAWTWARQHKHTRHTYDDGTHLDGR